MEVDQVKPDLVSTFKNACENGLLQVVKDNYDNVSPEVIAVK